MYAGKIANDEFHLSPETPGARVEGIRVHCICSVPLFSTMRMLHMRHCCNCCIICNMAKVVKSCLCLGGLKDVGLIQRLAKDCGVEMPLGKLMLDHLKEAGDQGWTDLDWTAVSRIIRQPAGIQDK